MESETVGSMNVTSSMPSRSHPALAQWYEEESCVVNRRGIVESPERDIAKSLVILTEGKNPPAKPLPAGQMCRGEL
jgi:hypothetical protein